MDLWDVAIGTKAAIRTLEAPEWRVLQAQMLAGTTPNVAAAAAHIAAALELREQGEVDAAHAHLRAAFAHAPRAPETSLHVAATLIATGDLAGAEAILHRVIEARCATPQIHVHLAHAIRGQGRHDEAFRGIAEAADEYAEDSAVIETAALFALLDGDARQAYDRAAGFLRRHDGAQCASIEAIAIRAAIACDCVPDAAIEARLATAADAGDADADALRSLLEVRSASRATWQDLLADRPVDRDRAARLRSSQELGEVLRLAPLPRVMPLGSEEARALYGDALVTPDAVIRDGFALPRSAGVAARGFMTTDIVARRGLIAAARRIQLESLRRERVCLHSPFGGVEVSQSGTVLNYAPERRELGSVIAYFFRQPRPSFALFVTEDHWPLAWYDPVEDVVLRHDGMLEFELYLQHRIVELKEVWLRLAADVESYLADERRVTALYPAIVDYLSTHLFAELGGLLRAIEHDAHEHAAQIVCLSPEPLGSLETLLPALSGLAIHREAPADAVALNRALFTSRHFPVRTTGGMVDDTLAARVVAHADARASPAWKAEFASLRGACWPLLFVSLRSQSRRLRLSGAEIAAIFEEVASVHPDLGLVFDGYAIADRPLPAAVLASEAAHIEGIVGHSRRPSLRSAGRSMSDSIYAAVRCDLHLSDQGTSTTKGALIANLPGVVIGPKQFGWDVRAFRDPPPLLLTPWHRARDVIAGNIQTDYLLAPDIIVESLLEVLRRAPSLKGRAH